jgi:hypothetical protein
VNWGTSTYSTFSNYISATGMEANSIYADPMLTNNSIPTPDFHLLNVSTCIDAGDPSFLIGNNETDYFGGTRILNSKVDIGAHEFVLPNSINENENNNSVSVYPNPTSGEFKVLGLKSPSEIQFYNYLGEKIYETNISSSQVKINLNAEKGIYLFKITSEKNVIGTGKLVIQ